MRSLYTEIKLSITNSVKEIGTCGLSMSALILFVAATYNPPISPGYPAIFAALCHFLPSGNKFAESLLFVLQLLGRFSFSKGIPVTMCAATAKIFDLHFFTKPSYKRIYLREVHIYLGHKPCSMHTWLNVDLPLDTSE